MQIYKKNYLQCDLTLYRGKYLSKNQFLKIDNFKIKTSLRKKDHIF